ncbi:MAG: hypothetical protein ACO1NS_02645 [Daejeonella sp.]
MEKLPQPYFWQWLLAMLPSNFIQRYHSQLNPILDSLFACFIYFISIKIGFDSHASVMAVLLYLFSPIFFSSLAIGPRINSITPRLWSEILCNILFICLFIPLSIALPTKIILSILLMNMILLSSKFGIQVLVFLIPISSIISGDYLGILVLAGSIVTATLITKGEFLKALKAQAHHLTQYFKSGLRNRMAISNRNSFTIFIKILKLEVPFREKIEKIIFAAVVTNSYTSVILKFTLVIAVIYFGLQTGPGNLPYSYRFIFYPVVASLILFVVVNINLFLFLGEAERYILHVGYFWIIAIVYLTQMNGINLIGYFLVSFGILYWLIEGFYLKNNQSVKALYQSQNENNLLMEYLNSLTYPINIALYPYHSAGGVWRILYETEHRVYYGITLTDEDRAKVIDFEDKYPYFKIGSLDLMAERFKLNLLILDTRERHAINIVEKSGNWKRLTGIVKNTVLFTNERLK